MVVRASKSHCRSSPIRPNVSQASPHQLLPENSYNLISEEHLLREELCTNSTTPFFVKTSAMDPQKTQWTHTSVFLSTPQQPGRVDLLVQVHPRKE